MSDKLVVEFFQGESEPKPVAAIMSLHGGDNPASASLTIADFIAAIRALRPRPDCDAYTLASRFILWSPMNFGSRPNFSDVEAELIPVSDRYNYQTVRVFADPERIRVELVPDEFTTDAELAEGNDLLERLQVL